MALTEEEARPDSERSMDLGGEGSPRDLIGPEEPFEEELPGVPIPPIRFALPAAFSLLAASTMVGGIFSGYLPRIQAGISGVFGVLVALAFTRIRRPFLANLITLAGLFVIGVVMVIGSGLDNVLNLASRVAAAADAGDLLRPPVQYLPGWRAILGWLMGALGFAAGWAALELRKPAVGTLIPLALVGFGAMSVPKDQQLVSGLIALVFLGISLGILSSAQEAEHRSVEFEVRRAVKALPLIAAIVGVLLILARTNLLFPRPIYDPAQTAQKPRAVPLTEVEDRVLFTVQSLVSGPWRIGTLDVYTEEDGHWRLPPYAQSRLKEVPRSGILDDELTPGVKAAFEIRGLSGMVFPGLSNLVGILSEGVPLVYDERTGSIRVGQGQVTEGAQYTVTAARLPTVEELRRVDQRPRNLESFLEVPDAPPSVADLLRQAPTTSSWDRLDFLRTRLLNTVVAQGPGTPVAVKPEKIEDMLVGSRLATPFEIVAAQAMLARWAGVPSRIGYGFDKGDKIGEDVFAVRPKHGATFLEIYFPGYKWLPVVGAPRRAQTNLSESEQQESSVVLPSDEIALDLFIPIILPPESILFEQVRNTVLWMLPGIAALLLIYYGYPALRKARLRAIRRTWANQSGPSERIAVAYAEWRDFTTDLGYRFGTDTPLMFLDRVADDEEHIALAWLTTRALWGDMQQQIRPQDAELAEDLSRSLRKRTSMVHPWTLRLVAALSRLSLRYPYAPRLGQPQARPAELTSVKRSA